MVAGALSVAGSSMEVEFPDEAVSWQAIASTRSGRRGVQRLSIIINGSQK
jgi:hypothetical protein